MIVAHSVVNNQEAEDLRIEIDEESSCTTLIIGGTRLYLYSGTEKRVLKRLHDVLHDRLNLKLKAAVER
jgi:hypothetical protein